MTITFYYDENGEMHIELFFYCCRKAYRKKARYIKSVMRKFNHIFVTGHEINAKSGTLVIDHFKK